MSGEELAFSLAGSAQPGLRLSGDTLTVWLHGRPRAIHSWEILAVRWLDHQHAELHLGSDERLVLPPVEDLAAAVRAIDEFAAAAPAKRRAQAGQQLERRRYFRARGPRRIAVELLRRIAAAVCLGLCLGLAVWIRRPDPDAPPWLVGVAAFVFCLIRLLPSAANITSRGIKVRARRLAWSEVLSVGPMRSIRDEPEIVPRRRMAIFTLRSVETFVGGSADCRFIKDYLAERRKWHRTTFQPAGSAPPPDNALSLARETGHDAGDRGLSQTIGYRGDD